MVARTAEEWLNKAEDEASIRLRSDDNEHMTPRNMQRVTVYVLMSMAHALITLDELVDQIRVAVEDLASSQ